MRGAAQPRHGCVHHFRFGLAGGKRVAADKHIEIALQIEPEQKFCRQPFALISDDAHFDILRVCAVEYRHEIVENARAMVNVLVVPQHKFFCRSRHIRIRKRYPMFAKAALQNHRRAAANQMAHFILRQRCQPVLPQNMVHRRVQIRICICQRAVEIE